MQQYRDILQKLGHTVTSRWIDLHGGEELESATSEILNSHPASVAKFAEHDIEDIEDSDLLLSFTSGGGGKGGRHVEFGYAIAAGKRLAIVGPREHVFHTLEFVDNFESFESFTQSGLLDEILKRSTA